MCQRAATRRDFLQRLALGSTVGASILDLAFRRAAWAQTMAGGRADRSLRDSKSGRRRLLRLRKAASRGQLQCGHLRQLRRRAGRRRPLETFRRRGTDRANQAADHAETGALPGGYAFSLGPLSRKCRLPECIRQRSEHHREPGDEAAGGEVLREQTEGVARSAWSPVFGAAAYPDSAGYCPATIEHRIALRSRRRRSGTASGNWRRLNARCGTSGRCCRR